MKRENKKGQFWGTFTPWLIGIAVLAIMAVFAYLMRDKLAAYGEKIFSALRGGR